MIRMSVRPRWLVESLLSMLLWPATIWGQYRADAAGAPPAELKPALVQLLAKTGFLITNNGAKYCELWLRTALPQIAAASKPSAAANRRNVTLPQIPLGAWLGVIRFDAGGLDRHGQRVAPGTYLLRYGILPGNGPHEGAAPHRDFLVLTPVGEDPDINSTPDFDALVALSRKASHTPHPAVLSFWRAENDAPGFGEQGDSDWVLETKIGDTPVDILVAGVAGS